MGNVVILHISDLHFGIENDLSDKTKYMRLRQKEMLTNLITTIEHIASETPDWKPDIIAISGDIAWSGQYEEYQLYKNSFAKPLAEALGIPLERIISCPGNHDIMRSKVRGLNRPYPGSKDPDVAELNHAQLLEQAPHFEGYINALCNGDPNKLCELITYEEWPWVSFLTLNSAWDCRNNQDEERLRVGLPLLENLIENVPDENYVITLFHHPHTEIEDYIEKIDTIHHRKTLETKKRTWLHISEREPEYTGARCFSAYVEQKSTFILNGHVHKEIEPQKLKKSIQLISGTLYSNDTPHYHCRLLKLSENADPCYRDIRHSLNNDNENWEITMPKNFHFDHVAILLSRKKAIEEQKQQFALRLIDAQKRYEEENDLELFQRTISEITQELMSDAIIPKNTLSENNVFISEKTRPLSQNDIFTLKNGGNL